MNTELTQAVEKLIDAGCHYRLDALAECYAPDLQIVIRQADGTLMPFDYAANMAFFRGLRDAGAAPLNTAVRFELAEVHGETGYVIAARRLDLGVAEKTIVFTLMLHKQAGRWQVFREHAVVLPEG